MATVKDRLFVAAATGDVKAVDKAIEEYKRANNNRFLTYEVTDADKRTIAHYACLYNTEEVALHILQKKNCSTPDQHGAYPYMYAAREGLEQLIRQWSSYSGITVKDNHGRNILHYCCGGGADSKPSIAGIQVAEKATNKTTSRVRCVQFLVEKGFDINEKDTFGKTPIQYYEEKGDEDMILELTLSNVISWSHLSANLPLHLMLKIRYPKCMELSTELSFAELLDKVKPKAFDLYKCLCKICDLKVPIQVEKDGPPENKIPEEVAHRLKYAGYVFDYLGEFVFKPKKSALRSALNNKFYEMITFLADKRARVILDEGQDIYEPILHWFVRTLFEEQNKGLLKDKVTSLEKLVGECNLDVNALDDRGMSPLHQLCSDTYETEPRSWVSLRVALVEKLIKLGAEIDVEDPKGRTPLMLAARAGHVDVILQLLTSGADPIRANKWGHTAFWSTKDEEILALLKEYQTSPAEKPKENTGFLKKKKGEFPIGKESGTQDEPSSEPFLAAMAGLLNRLEYLETSVDHLSNNNTELTQTVNNLTEQIQELKQPILKQ